MASNLLVHTERKTTDTIASNQEILDILNVEICGERFWTNEISWWTGLPMSLYIKKNKKNI